MVYRMKVWRLPAATPQGTGKALINLLPLEQGEVITTILQLPEDTSTWGERELMFATRTGNVRRNSLADFENINRNGKIAMKLDEGDQIVNVALCAPSDDVLLTSVVGQCIRFPADDVRLFKGRDSTGVRGVRLDDEDRVISMAILTHVEATPAERAAYLKQAGAMRRATGEGVENGVEEAVPDAEIEEATGEELTPERYAELGAREQFVLTVSSRGFGKRSSSYEYRVSGRGGKGIVAMVVNDRNGPLVASFPVDESDQIMLVTDGGQLIRCPVDDVRVAGRNTQGVRIFRTDEDETVASVERIPEDANGENGAENGDGGEDGAPTAE
jgi:DNA gyrase subunit A